MGLLFNHDRGKRTSSAHPCPRCGSTNVEQQEKGLVPLPASPLTTFDGTHVAPVSEFRCLDCGYSWEDIF
ncbi:MAG: hypothetical protein ACOX12_01550 [Eggerthellaceae bacterium]|jgi:transposase-like protein